MSESLIAGGWRVRDDVFDLTEVDPRDRTVPLDVPQRKYRRGALVRRALLFADVAGLTIAFVLANALLPSFSSTVDRVSPGYEYLAFLFAIPGWILLLRLEGLYDRDEERTDHSTVDDFVGVFRGVTIGVWVFALFVLATGIVQPGFARLGLFWVLAIVLIPTLRAFARSLCRHLPGYTQNAIIVGAGNVGQQLALKLTNHREYGINLVGFVDDHPTELDDELAERLPLLLGGPDRLRECVTRARHRARDHRLLERLARGRPRKHPRHPRPGRPDRHRPPVLRGLRRRRRAAHARGDPARRPAADAALPFFARSQAHVRPRGVGARPGRPRAAVCRCRGVHQARVAAGRCSSGRCAAARTGSTFRIYKFRTMVVEAEERKAEVVHLNMHRNRDPRMTKIPDDPRVTRVGRFLRRTLDRRAAAADQRRSRARCRSSGRGR